MSLGAQLAAIKEEMKKTGNQNPVLLGSPTAKDELDVIFEKLGKQTLPEQELASQPTQATPKVETKKGWFRQEIKPKAVTKKPTALQKQQEKSDLFLDAKNIEAQRLKNQLLHEKDAGFINNRVDGALGISGATLKELNQQRFDAMTQLQQNQINAQRTNAVMDMVARLVIANELA
tara:strand:+ start:276 stop:803 length:528 start_codon:yes stop_codon:yes gene_type:complete